MSELDDAARALVHDAIRKAMFVAGASYQMPPDVATALYEQSKISGDVQEYIRADWYATSVTPAAIEAVLQIVEPEGSLNIQVLMPDGAYRPACWVADGVIAFDWTAIEHGASQSPASLQPFAAALCRVLLAAHEAGYWAKRT
jgi:hypothetical protein